MNNKEYFDTLLVCGRLNTRSDRQKELLREYIGIIEKSKVSVKDLMDSVRNLNDMQFYTMIHISSEIIKKVKIEKEIYICYKELCKLINYYKKYCIEYLRDFIDFFNYLVCYTSGSEESWYGTIIEYINIYKVVEVKPSDIINITFNNDNYTLDKENNSIDMVGDNGKEINNIALVYIKGNKTFVVKNSILNEGFDRNYYINKVDYDIMFV